MTSAGAARRAPRLGPEELIAPHITRLGRFRKIDPRKPKALPGVARVLGVVAWAALLVESTRRAIKADREAQARGAVGADEGRS